MPLIVWVNVVCLKYVIVVILMENCGFVSWEQDLLLNVIYYSFLSLCTYVRWFWFEWKFNFASWSCLIKSVKKTYCSLNELKNKNLLSLLNYVQIGITTVHTQVLFGMSSQLNIDMITITLYLFWIDSEHNSCSVVYLWFTHFNSNCY